MPDGYFDFYCCSDLQMDQYPPQSLNQDVYIWSLWSSLSTFFLLQALAANSD